MKALALYFSNIINVKSQIKSLTIERGENVLLKCIDDKLEEQIQQNSDFEGKMPHWDKTTKLLFGN